MNPNKTFPLGPRVKDTTQDLLDFGRPVTSLDELGELPHDAVLALKDPQGDYLVIPANSLSPLNGHGFRAELLKFAEGHFTDYPHGPDLIWYSHEEERLITPKDLAKKNVVLVDNYPLLEQAAHARFPY